ncbi:MAG: DoxX family protein [Gaiellales bacterium]
MLEIGVVMSFGVLLLRLLVGLTLAAHGSQKLFGALGGSGPTGTSAYFKSLGFRAPIVMAVMAGLAEFGGGLLFAAGLLTPLAGLAVAVVMLNAIGSEHWDKGFFNYAGGYEYNLLVLFSAVAVTAIGPGRASLDHALGWDASISGAWWGAGMLVIALVLAAGTLTLGRTTTSLGTGKVEGGTPSTSA